jgi:hypothetical protein
LLVRSATLACQVGDAFRHFVQRLFGVLEAAARTARTHDFAQRCFNGVRNSLAAGAAGDGSDLGFKTSLQCSPGLVVQSDGPK